MKGWYIPARPDGPAGESTAWYASFWAFCAAYLHARFGTDWCLSPEQSLLLHAGNHTVPGQLLVRAPKGGNKPTQLLHGTSVLDVRAVMPAGDDVEELDGLRLYALPAALVASGPAFYRQHPTDARAALTTVDDASDVLGRLLEGGHSKIAGRLAGAFRNVGRTRIADSIVQTMHAAGYTVREEDPFDDAGPATFNIRVLAACEPPAQHVGVDARPQHWKVAPGAEAPFQPRRVSRARRIRTTMRLTRSTATPSRRAVTGRPIRPSAIACAGSWTGRTQERWQMMTMGVGTGRSLRRALPRVSSGPRNWPGTEMTRSLFAALCTCPPTAKPSGK